jgi:Flp pilus assembly protein TadG
MRTVSLTVARGRSGAIAPLTVILLIPLLGMVAFAIDTGYMVVSQTELQNTADAAALAGAQMMMDPFTQWSLPTLTSGQQATILANGKTAAANAAKNYAGYNTAGGANILLQDPDIVFGFTDSQGNFTTNFPSSTFPNTIQVTARRDSTGGSKTNKPLPLFFGPVLGTPSVNLTASARATIYTGTVSSLNNNLGVNGPLLPVAVNVQAWDQFMKDGTGADSSNSAPNGLPQLQAYPGGGGQSGNFGLLSLNGSKAPSVGYYGGNQSWIQAGPTTGPNSDVSSLLSTGNLPLPASSNWAAGPGLKSSLIGDFQAAEGKPRLLPLFDTSGGNGSNAWYNVVAFVGVTISYANGTGSNMTIDVQPAAVIDPTLIFSSWAPAGASNSGRPSFTFLPPKLTN